MSSFCTWPAAVFAISDHGASGAQCDCCGEATADSIDPVLVRLIQESFAIRTVVLSDTRETLNEITARRKKSKGYLTAFMRLSYLAPHIAADILDGRQPPELNAKHLLRTSGRLPLEWQSQRTHLRFASAYSGD